MLNYIKHYDYKKYYWPVMLFIIPLTGIGCMAISKVSSELAVKQLAGVAVGFAIMAVLSLIDYQQILALSWLLYIGNLVLLVLVRIPGIGVEVNNARRWINVGIQIQPSEISKIVLIIFAAAYLRKHKEDLNTVLTLFKFAVLMGVPTILVLMQPNLSTTIITVAVILLLLILGGLGRKILLWGGGSAAVLLGGAIWYIQQPGQKLLKGYQLQRILGFINPQKYSHTFYQQENSLTAIGSGGLYGSLKGGSNLTITDAGFLPEAQTDFIYAIVGQEWGFIGAAAVIILLAVIVGMCFYIGIRCEDTAGKLICYGMGCLIAVQSILNIGVATAILPNTGVPLPFISYGLTSMWSLCIGMGIVLNVRLWQH